MGLRDNFFAKKPSSIRQTNSTDHRAVGDREIPYCGRFQDPHGTPSIPHLAAEPPRGGACPRILPPCPLGIVPPNPYSPNTSAPQSYPSSSSEAVGGGGAGGGRGPYPTPSYLSQASRPSSYPPGAPPPCPYYLGAGPSPFSPPPASTGLSSHPPALEGEALGGPSPYPLPVGGGGPPFCPTGASTSASGSGLLSHSRPSYPPPSHPPLSGGEAVPGPFPYSLPGAGGGGGPTSHPTGASITASGNSLSSHPTSLGGEAAEGPFLNSLPGGGSPFSNPTGASTSPSGTGLSSHPHPSGSEAIGGPFPYPLPCGGGGPSSHSTGASTSPSGSGLSSSSPPSGSQGVTGPSPNSLSCGRGGEGPSSHPTGASASAYPPSDADPSSLPPSDAAASPPLSPYSPLVQPPPSSIPPALDTIPISPSSSPSSGPMSVPHAPSSSSPPATPSSSSSCLHDSNLPSPASQPCHPPFFARYHDSTCSEPRIDYAPISQSGSAIPRYPTRGELCMYQIPDFYFCTLCSDVLRNPVILPSCHHDICNDCFVSACRKLPSRSQPVCPVTGCARPIHDAPVPNVDIQRRLGSTPVRCVNGMSYDIGSGKFKRLKMNVNELDNPPADNYCRVQLTYDSMNSHFPVCPYLLKQCRFQPQCEAICLVRDLAEHEANCAWRSTVCRHCNQGMPQSLVQGHMKNDCEMISLNCQYGSFGCSFTGRRATLKVHVEQCPFGEPNVKASFEEITAELSRIKIRLHEERDLVAGLQRQLQYFQHQHGSY